MPRGYGGFTSALLPLISAYFRMFLMLVGMLLPQFFRVSAFISAFFPVFGLHFRLRKCAEMAF